MSQEEFSDAVRFVAAAILVILVILGASLGIGVLVNAQGDFSMSRTATMMSIQATYRAPDSKATVSTATMPAPSTPAH